jgi:hypothetical protein
VKTVEVGLGLDVLEPPSRASTPETGRRTPSNDMLAALSSDGETLVFTSDRPEGFGGADLYVTTRPRR